MATNFVTKPIPEKMPDVPVINRPWGSFEQYAFNQDVTVSLMEVKSNLRLSLQSHTGRGEMWIVMDQGAIIQVGDEILHPKPGERVWIPANTRHRLSCSPDAPSVRVLEVAFGNWQQDDITRYEDDYSRPAKGE